ncbi:Ubiquitin-related modifier 1 -like protein [Echinococcus granulosus]|uniref:Ubiquitin-related modifier 1 homolog n=2 Tax=Echinococcus TaxID=6209 RepID=U6J1F9_ECHGR|nr:Ubiquitin-related modifier [Echinococcus granulosus]EUB62549.1 Ubiquitin-related modifier [Echinococcus granulosus]KAH9283372.1 Ubiquitin-related modifier 1 -like protein [Echinococcus granulosus]CDS17136.1 Ubiquitin modifier 1 protein [Echinococcus granulosus]CDS42163.1 Ubiquitin modifier 1 protein [Echinococcus multilocularis]
MRIALEFSGGAELLFGNKKEQSADLPDSVKTIKELLPWLRDHMLTGRPDLFITNNSIRPGILTLVNDTDWSLLGEEEYQLREKDKVSFISTLHGG